MRYKDSAHLWPSQSNPIFRKKALRMSCMAPEATVASGHVHITSWVICMINLIVCISLPRSHLKSHNSFC